VLRVLSDGTYLTALITPSIRGARRERLLAAAHAGQDLTDINTVPDAFDQHGLPVIHLARVIEYDVPDRVGNGIVHHVISALTAKASAAADLDPDRVSFGQALRLIRRTATATAAIPPCGLG
jgi:hypothetical protein